MSFIRYSHSIAHLLSSIRSFSEWNLSQWFYHRSHLYTRMCIALMYKKIDFLLITHTRLYSHSVTPQTKRSFEISWGSRDWRGVSASQVFMRDLARLLFVLWLRSYSHRSNHSRWFKNWELFRVCSCFSRRLPEFCLVQLCFHGLPSEGNVLMTLKNEKMWCRFFFL